MHLMIKLPFLIKSAWNKSVPSTNGNKIFSDSITNILTKYLIWPQLRLNIFIRGSCPNIDIFIINNRYRQKCITNVTWRVMQENTLINDKLCDMWSRSSEVGRLCTPLCLYRGSVLDHRQGAGWDCHTTSCNQTANKVPG